MLRRRAEQSSRLSADSRRLINDEAASAPAPIAAKWRRQTHKQSYTPMVVEREHQVRSVGCLDEGQNKALDSAPTQEG
nr:hypothetical protein CFP56_64806 [Quercus suber]